MKIEANGQERQNQHDIFNKETALSNFNNDIGLFEEIVNLFLESARNNMIEIYHAIANGECEVLERVACKIKGSASCLAANNAFEAASEMETIGRNGDLTGAEEAYVELVKEIERLKPILTAEL